MAPVRAACKVEGDWEMGNEVKLMTPHEVLPLKLKSN